jgi:hypothetical protein
MTPQLYKDSALYNTSESIPFPLLPTILHNKYTNIASPLILKKESKSTTINMKAH